MKWDSSLKCDTKRSNPSLPKKNFKLKQKRWFEELKEVSNKWKETFEVWKEVKMNTLKRWIF